MLIKSYRGKTPRIEKDVFIAETAALIGDVRIGQGSSIWYGTVLRGDINYVEIGENTNVQDNAVFHVADNRPVIVGNGVTVGHGAIVHGCTVADDCFIGMGAILLDGAVIGEGSLVAAGALVKEGMEIPPRSLVMGIPGKIVARIGDDRLRGMKDMAVKYRGIAEHHRRDGL